MTSVAVWNETKETTLGDRIAVANNANQRRTGLLKHKSLRAGEGLWIAPCEAVHTFAMRFAIDLVYLDRHKRVRKVRSDVRPGRLSVCLTAHSVLELPAGTVLASKTSPGDRLSLVSHDL